MTCLPIPRLPLAMRGAVSAFLLFTTATLPILAAEPGKEGVSLTVDFNDGSQLRYTGLDWNDKMTALAALEVAAKHRRGFEYKVRGSGSIAFVTEIEGQSNEGANGRNWLFKVNGKLAKVGAGSHKLQQGDRVEWEFTRYDEIP